MSNSGPSWSRLVPLWSHCLGPTQVLAFLILADNNVCLVPLTNIYVDTRTVQGETFHLSCGNTIFLRHIGKHALRCESGTRMHFCP